MLDFLNGPDDLCTLLEVVGVAHLYQRNGRQVHCGLDLLAFLFKDRVVLNLYGLSQFLSVNYDRLLRARNIKTYSLFTVALDARIEVIKHG